MTTELAVRDTHVASGFEMKPRTLDEAMKYCDLMAASDLVPNGYKGKPGNIMVAIQMGQELGMTPMRALRSIAVINGRASMWGDDMLAMVLASPVCEYVREGDSTDKAGVCRVKRKGDSEEHASTFTLDDAKRAGLLGKQGPWQTATSRMLKLRARGFALRDKFADVLAGLVTAEEAYDLTAEQPAVSVVEKDVPAPTLKDKLKAKIESVSVPEPQEMQEPARQEVHKPASSTSATGTDEHMLEQQQRPAAPFISEWKVPNAAWMKPDCGKRADELDDQTVTKYINYYEQKLAKEPQSRYRGEWDEALRALIAVAMHREQSNPTLI